MELCCEYDIPINKAGDVVNTVFKWVFDKEVSDTVPAPSAINFVDHAHVVSKRQLVEEMLNPDRWNLHVDGTTRNGERFVSNQETLNSGQTLSAGFHIVSVENSCTLLDNVICMLQSLTQICIEEKKDGI